MTQLEGLRLATQTTVDCDVASLQASALAPIASRYLLVIEIPCYRDPQGRYYVDPLWHKDLVEHTRYLKHLVLACPCVSEPPPKDAIALDSHPATATIEIIGLPPVTSPLRALFNSPKTFKILSSAIAQADIVHCGIGGYAVPPSWLVSPLTRWHRKFYFLNVESATWRCPPGLTPKFKHRVKEFIYESINRWSLNYAHLATFTQLGYRQSLMRQNPERGHVINASWIDADNILPEDLAMAAWQTKLAQAPQELRLLFAGRLEVAKGVLVLLEAMQQLQQRGVAVKLDILGNGSLTEHCRAISQTPEWATNIRFLGTVPYGREFFEILQQYHAIVVPSISDEQPRIVYDAYAQAIPVIASNTSGLQDCIRPEVTGKLVPVGDPVALAEACEWALHHRAQLAQMGLTGLSVAKTFTHQEMHRQRWQLLVEQFEQWQRQ